MNSCNYCEVPITPATSHIGKPGIKIVFEDSEQEEIIGEFLHLPAEYCGAGCFIKDMNRAFGEKGKVLRLKVGDNAYGLESKLEDLNDSIKDKVKSNIPLVKAEEKFLEKYEEITKSIKNVKEAQYRD